MRKFYCGNDIFDLAYNKKETWRQTRFLSKILTNSELVFINNNNKIDFLPELFFSCKESAYKYFVKQNRLKGFNPRSFDVVIDDEPYSWINRKIHLKGEVRCDFGETNFLSEISPGFYIHTICYSVNYHATPLCFVIEDESLSVAGESEKIYNVMKNFLEKNSLFKAGRIEIIKNNNTQVPYVFLNGIKAPCDISLSHDGKYFAGCVIK